jgi:hypothetical protein
LSATATISRDAARESRVAATPARGLLCGVEAHYNASGQPSESYTTVSLGAPVARIDRTADSTGMQYQFHGLGGSTLAAIDHLTGTVDAVATRARSSKPSTPAETTASRRSTTS